ncbi:FAD-dependent oxidoreductase [Streptoalloteichus hindustanus]|uniref:2-polyprenyl-6-methoxyphenol hydroxylase n=1 Tax=Streptoalloteichus hindustanus TaxID=2017 RepID=A0A1M5DC41_STRHI|nr:NAD(P)/FAD-dependent oxidoreductase [Streptoalloteichus hindustanus]SHF64569.1 2-polyprenyl-6-methoxyphenol hydroxylase [Streptoalloteichus hindustanus]
MRVVVIGAGLGGLCLAQGLRQAGIEVDVYERDPGVHARFQGYRLGLSEVGAEALRGCLPHHLHPVLTAITGELAGDRPVVDPRLEPVGDLGPTTGTAVDRHVLRHLLLDGLDVRFGHQLTDHQVGEDGRVRVHFAHGQTTTADLLVGADGIGSAVRAQLAPEIRPEDTGVRFVLGRTPLTDRFARLVPGFGTVAKGSGLTLMLGLMRFRVPPRQAAPWLPDTPDYVRWVGMPTSPAPLAELMRDWHPDLRAVVEATDTAHSAQLSIRVVRPGARWPLGPVTLLGDAIHATSPSGGNGANTALRDADLLRRNLIAVAAHRGNLLDAVDDYERQMIDYGAEAVAHSLRALPSFVPTPGPEPLPTTR